MWYKKKRNRTQNSFNFEFLIPHQEVSSNLFSSSSIFILFKNEKIQSSMIQIATSSGLSKPWQHTITQILHKHLRHIITKCTYVPGLSQTVTITSCPVGTRKLPGNRVKRWWQQEDPLKTHSAVCSLYTRRKWLWFEWWLSLCDAVSLAQIVNVITMLFLTAIQK